MAASVGVDHATGDLVAAAARHSHLQGVDRQR